MEPVARALCVVVLHAAFHEFGSTSGLVVQEDSQQHPAAVLRFARCGGWNVAGAVRHRYRQPESRFPEFVVWAVLSNAMGLGNLHRHARVLLGMHVPVPASAASSLDL